MNKEDNNNKEIYLMRVVKTWMMILLILDHYKIIDKVEILDKNKMEVMYLKIHRLETIMEDRAVLYLE
jgi:hypothetical protein